MRPQKPADNTVLLSRLWPYGPAACGVAWWPLAVAWAAVLIRQIRLTLEGRRMRRQKTALTDPAGTPPLVAARFPTRLGEQGLALGTLPGLGWKPAPWPGRAPAAGTLSPVQLLGGGCSPDGAAVAADRQPAGRDGRRAE
jgi:hypothetical protein